MTNQDTNEYNLQQLKIVDEIYSSIKMIGADDKIAINMLRVANREMIGGLEDDLKYRPNDLAAM